MFYHIIVQSFAIAKLYFVSLEYFNMMREAVLLMIIVHFVAAQGKYECTCIHVCYCMY